ncbi:MAG: hypothetical protein R6W96_00705 [Clostridia bacterium]
MICDNNKIEIAMPCKAEYVGILRLASAGAANEAGFDIETIDDVKILVSEIFNSVFNAGIPSFKTDIHMEKGKLFIDFEVCEGNDILAGANDMTLPILEALAREVTVHGRNKISLVIV